MSHRFAMVFSIALTLLLAGGVYASRDRLLATSESGAQPVSVVDQSAGASTTDNERVPPVRRSLDLPEQQPSFASEISAGDDENDDADEDDRDSESVNNDDDDHDSGEHDDDDDDHESDDDD